MPGLTWDESEDCGACWELSYTNETTTNTIRVTAVDRAGFILSPEAMDAFAGGIAVEKGSVDAVATRVGPSNCGGRWFSAA